MDFPVLIDEKRELEIVDVLVGPVRLALRYLVRLGLVGIERGQDVAAGILRSILSRRSGLVGVVHDRRTLDLDSFLHRGAEQQRRPGAFVWPSGSWS
jgi:hypothetical protein